MTCSEFQNHFSDYHDSLGDPAFMAAASAHLDGCPECRRYRGVVEQGVEVLRSLPYPSVGDDFLLRLKHRIYHLEDGPALRRREMAGSATTTTTAFAIAALIAVAAWSPVLTLAPEVVLDPIVVTRPEPRVIGIRPASPRALLVQLAREEAMVHRGLWDDPLLLTRYSPLTAGRTRSASAMRQADLE